MDSLPSTSIKKTATYLLRPLKVRKPVYKVKFCTEETSPGNPARRLFPVDRLGAGRPRVRRRHLHNIRSLLGRAILEGKDVRGVESFGDEGTVRAGVEESGTQREFIG